jgi:hypothetical protein
MKSKMTGAAEFAAAFLAGVLVATALGGGMAAGAKSQSAAVQGQQVNVQRVFSPSSGRSTNTTRTTCMKCTTRSTHC